MATEDKFRDAFNLQTSGKYLLLNNLGHSLPKSFGQNNTVEKSLRFSNTLASLARLSFVLLFSPCWDKQTQHAFSLCYSPPQTQLMILLFAVLMRYLHVSWSRKRDIGDITSSPPLRLIVKSTLMTSMSSEMFAVLMNN